MLLKSILHPSDIKSLTHEQLQTLVYELRSYIIETILEVGGHFAGNLGVVELTVALHNILDFNNNDSLIWDVGHQSYVHKCLTGRYKNLPFIRTFDHISGFPKRDESKFDFFGTGHSSTSISATMGMAVANLNNNSVHVAVIGDGALTAGLAFEALNNLLNSNANVLIILNDNNMGIDPNTGALNSHLRNNATNSIQSFFEFYGLKYNGPVDGHDLKSLLEEIQRCYLQKGPRLLHVKTTKGKGYLPAEKEQTKWHSAAKYVKVETPPNSQSRETAIKWQDVFGAALVEILSSNSKAVAITPAMPSSCGMMPAMDKFPDRIFDVGIAEQHALTFAAGYATTGNKPIVNIYSSFLQRAYDQWIHDVALQKLPVLLCIDRAGLVGEDGPTHHGAFDISFLRCIPDTVLLAPHNGVEFFKQMLWSMHQNKPIAIRYPKGNIPDLDEYLNFIQSVNSLNLSDYSPFNPIWITKNPESKILLITTGQGTQLAREGNKTKKVAHLHVNTIHANANTLFLYDLTTQFDHIITVEDGSILGGWGTGIIQEMLLSGWIGTYQNLGIPNTFIPHGSNNILYELCGYSPKQIEQTISSYLKK